MRLPSAALRARRMCTASMQEPPPPPDTLLEKAMTFAHRLVASGLVIVSAGGLAFVMYGSWEIYDRNMKKIKLKEQQKLQQQQSN
jgi:hypothetical protein